MIFLKKILITVMICIRFQTIPGLPKRSELTFNLNFSNNAQSFSLYFSTSRDVSIYRCSNLVK